jgi:general stress protein 26
LFVGILIMVWSCMGTKEVTKVEFEERGETLAIEATAQVSDTHPEIEEGITCADCHEVLVDATTKATEVWLDKDYLNFSAGEGLESNEETKKHILDILGGKKKKNTYILSTCINNIPLATTFDAGINPNKMTMYIFSEKGTEKLSHMRANPRVSIGWHREFTTFGKTLCIQMRGTAEVIDDPAKYDEGLATYPYEEIAAAMKLESEKFAENMIKSSMTMTKITINQIIITDSQYSREKGVRVHQIWRREK